MLSQKEYLKKFNKLQKLTIKVTNEVIKWITPSITEKDIADKYYLLLNKSGLTKHWYPILVYSGTLTAKPITRRVHLPSNKIKVKENDIVFLDSTPMDGTVWSNWCDTVVVGKNDFYENLIEDVKQIVNETAKYIKNKNITVGDVYRYAVELINKHNLEILDPYKDIGHSIFQVPEHQTVDKTPMKDRLLLNENYKAKKLEGIISIEPQLGRTNLTNGKKYGAKLQKVVIF